MESEILTKSYIQGLEDFKNGEFSLPSKNKEKQQEIADKNLLDSLRLIPNMIAEQMGEKNDVGVSPR